MIAHDRRTHRRVDARQRLRVQILRLDVEVTLVDVSFGGFQVDAPVAFGHDATYDVWLTTLDGAQSAIMRAKAIYCHRVPSEDTASYRTGFAFLELRDPETQKRIQALMADVVDVPG